MITTRRKTYLRNSTKQQISTVYTLTRTIRSKIFNHKELIKTLDAKDILDNRNNLLVTAQHHHLHIQSAGIL